METNLTESYTSLKLKGKKKRMIEALRKTLMVSIACRETKVSRQTHYDWISSDSLYQKEVDFVWAEVVDIAQGELFSKIKAGDLKAIMFFLKARGDYSEKQEIEMSGNIMQKDDPEMIKIIHELPDEIRHKLMRL